ncbi:MAG TPA: NUDIX domain-containing protein [Thermomicrobiales bacterium]
MISFDTVNGCFNYRTAAAVVHDAHVLLCREADGDSWFLPGGRCEMMESSQVAVKRELREELGAEGTVERLLWVVENFFVFNKRRFHEIGLYFLVSLPIGSPLLDKTQSIAFREAIGIDLEARWFRLTEVPATNLQPAFLRTELSELPEVPRHVVFDEVGR